MRILFMGTPDFAVSSLEALYTAGHEICAVFTQADKPQNRGQKQKAPAVKEYALTVGLPVFQPTSLKDEAVVSQIAALQADIIVVVAYGKLLPKEILSLPPYGCINVHGSLLPKYRGAAPIQWAILNGEATTGVTIMQMDEGLDTGDILSMETLDILPNETAGELFLRLKTQGAQLLLQTLVDIEKGEVAPVPQDHGKASFAPPLSRDNSLVNWALSAQEIHWQIRGLHPWPMAKTQIAGRELKLHASVVKDGVGTPGEILSAGKDGLEIACGTGSLLIVTLQAAGKKAMSAADYLRGNPIE